MKKVACRLDDLALAHVERLATAMGATVSDAIRTIIHRDRHMSAYMEAAAVQARRFEEVAAGRGTDRTQAKHKG